MKIAVITDSAGPASNNEAVARWVYELARRRTDAEFELLDLRNDLLPVVDGPTSASLEQSTQPDGKAWAAKIATFDGYVFVVPESNHGTSPAMRNVIDSTSVEWTNKAAGIVSHGSSDGARAVEQLRPALSEVMAATVCAQVELSSCTDFDGFVTFQPDRRREQEVHTLFDQVIACSRMGSVMSEWYALNPDVRRLWVHEADETAPDDARDIYVTVALTPVCDSDDISPIWLSKCTAWQRHLQSLIGRRVHLDWFDAESEVVPCEEVPAHARVCLTSIAWREPDW